MGLGISTSLRHADLRDTCGATPGGCSEDDIDGVRARAVATDVVLGLAGGAAVAAVVLFFVEGRTREPAPSRVWIAPGQGGAVAGLRGRF
jgi:hypothetical protein